jgi:hypothetical protein
MNWLKPFFAVSASKPSANDSAKPAVASVGTSGGSWYRATTKDNRVRQVVLSLPPEQLTETPFSSIILPADKYPALVTSSWCAGFCRINGQYVAMLRAGGFAEAVKSAGVTMAISFCHMPSHAVVFVSVRIESPSLAAAVRARYSHVAPLSRPVAEWLSGLSPYDRELLPAVFATNPFRLVLADDGPNRSSILQPDGSFFETCLPQAVGEFTLQLDDKARQVLQEEWKALLQHHDSIPDYRRDFRKAANLELAQQFRIDEDTILPNLK